ncbi:MAG: class I SAM-dependent methyltransferase [Arenicellaceae bacterium]|nr:class I SAM-dependent methyltransferase [Arenicellaceae bacterium]
MMNIQNTVAHQFKLSINHLLAVSLISILSGASLAHEGEHGPQNHSNAHMKDANAHMNEAPFEDLAANFDSPDRAIWQKPADAIAALGDLAGKTVMDIGSGTGYFSFKLVDAGASVICADVDERFLGFIKEKRDRLGLTDKMELRLVPYDSANLSAEEADIVLIVDTYHHIKDRENYFSAVRAGIKPGGKLMVIDFEKRELPVGPPVSMKLDAETVVNELRAAGFQNIDVNYELLPYQFMISAS